MRSFLGKRLLRQFSGVSAVSELPSPRLDYRSISENVAYKSANALNRKAPVSVDDIQSVARTYAQYKSVYTHLNAKRNARSIIGEKMRKSAAENDLAAKNASLAEAKHLKQEISLLEASLSDIEQNMLNLALGIPNDTHPAVPLGPESAAMVLSSHGPDPLPANSSRDHLTVGRKLGLIDLESAAIVTGTSWYYLSHEATLLEIALSNYALSVAMMHGFTPITTPDVVRADIARRCGFHPRDHSDPPVTQSYHLEPSSSHELILSGTAEIPLAGMFANRILPHADLPIKVVGIGRAFRAEAGARGADTRGLYRVHQFTKVELFALTTEAESDAMMEDMRNVQASILSGLGLPFRVLDMPTEELGASAYRKYDMEVWMPGRAKWGEVSSLSNCTDYQSRRLHIRHSALPKSKLTSSASNHNPFVHTLNGTAAAIPRLIVALLENGVVLDNVGEAVGVRLPEVLKPFWIGHEDKRNIVQWM